MTSIGKTVADRGDDSATFEGSVDVIRAAALSVFVEHGFDGSSMREVAGRANMSIAGLYHHFPSKLDILFDLMSRTMDEIIEGGRATLEAAGIDSGSRLAAVVRMHVLFHVQRRAESVVSNTELRSLDLPRREKIMVKRDSYQRTIYEIIAEGQRRREFDVSDVAGVTRALITMCTAVSTWYREDGPSTPEEIADLYSELALRMVGQKRLAEHVAAGGSPPP
jgi:AcrR family transcriptional regulator